MNTSKYSGYNRESVQRRSGESKSEFKSNLQQKEKRTKEKSLINFERESEASINSKLEDDAWEILKS